MHLFGIHTALTDNGVEFTLRCLWRKSNKIHPFESVCADLGIKHKLTKPCHPWTNGMVERHNRRIKTDNLYSKPYASLEEMKYDCFPSDIPITSPTDDCSTDSLHFRRSPGYNVVRLNTYLIPTMQNGIYR